MATRCEGCGELNPKKYEKGPFAGSTLELEYCKFCSADLCDDCMEVDPCPESDDGYHKSVEEDEDE